MQTRHFPSSQKAAEATAKRIEDHLKEASLSAVPVLLLLSGGSNLEVFRNISQESLRSNVAMTVLDERYSTNLNQNNSLQLIKLGANIKPVMPKGSESLESFASRHEEFIRSWEKTNPTGKVIATVGIGKDGHVAGISPFKNDKTKFNSLFVDTDSWVVGYEGDLNPPERITVTTKFLKHEVNLAIVHVVGSNKKDALQKVISEPRPLHQLPAKILLEMKGEVEVFTDQDVDSQSFS